MVSYRRTPTLDAAPVEIVKGAAWTLFTRPYPDWLTAALEDHPDAGAWRDDLDAIALVPAEGGAWPSPDRLATCSSYRYEVDGWTIVTLHHA